MHEHGVIDAKPADVVDYVAKLDAELRVRAARRAVREPTIEGNDMADFSGITNFVQLTPDVGTSGQPTREQFAAIADDGYRAVVNLALPTSDHAIADEGSVVTGLGMSYFHIPVDFKNPTADDLRTFVGTMRALEGHKVWVHCVMNLRVSAFMYHYLKRARGYDEAAARSPVLPRWEPRMEQVWKDFLALDIDLDGAR